MRRHLEITAQSAAYVMVSFPIGLVALVWLSVGLPLGFGLVPAFLLGLPVLAVVILGWSALARLERRRAAPVLGTPIPQPPARVPDERLAARWRARLGDAMTWRELGWTALISIFGLIAPSLLLGLASGTIALLVLPLVAPLAADDSGLAVWPAPLLMPLLAVPAAALTALAARGLALGLALTARALLAPSDNVLLAARVESLETTRAGAVESADATLRRIERDLHDGAQHRLAYVAMELGRAREKLDDDPEAARLLVERAHDESKRAMSELRDLVRGVHPSVLADRGLAAAISGVAGRSPVPVSVRVEIDPRPGRAAETAAYFVVAEALANVGRHSRATCAEVAVTRAHDRLEITISDDGRGGADAAPGSGLAGLAQRVEALDGFFGVVSTPGEGTTVWAELPCGS